MSRCQAGDLSVLSSIAGHLAAEPEGRPTAELGRNFLAE